MTFKNRMVSSLNSRRISSPLTLSLSRKGRGNVFWEGARGRVKETIATANTTNDIETFNKKSGIAKSFLNNTPSNISVNTIWVRLNIKVPISLSIKDRECLFLKRRTYHEENKRKFIMIYPIIGT
jgi:hypothetical protein